jgi:FMNH2-dependent dimethyl sulfone monooxygenase
MLFGLYAPVPHVTVGSSEIARAVREAACALPSGALDRQYLLSHDVLLAADRAGFDIVLFAERHLGTDLEAWMLAGAIGPQMRRARSMVAVHPGLWSPQLIAKMAASLDRMCPARMSVNLVTGWNVEEARMYGADLLLGDDERYVRAEEFVHVLRGMWQETPFSFKGRYYDVDKAELLLKPATATPPEIFTASRSPRGLDMVARIADWWFLDFDKTARTTYEVEDSLRCSIEAVEERADRLGRRVRFAFNPFVSFGSSRETAIAEARRLLTPDGPDADMRKLEQLIRPAMTAGCVGHPDDVRAQVQKYAAMGIELLLLKFPPTAERVEEIRRELIDPLRGTVSHVRAAE